MSVRPPAIFVYGLHEPAYARLLPHLSAENRNLLILADPAMVRAAEAAGIWHVPYEATNPPPVASTARAVQYRAAELFRHSDLEVRLAGHFRAPGGGTVWAGIRREFAHVLETVLVEGVDGVEMAAHLLGAADVRVVVAGFDMTAFARGLLGAFEAAGVPSLHVPHGLFGPTRGIVMPGTCAEIYATQVAAPGPQARALYAENGQALDRVAVTGAPRWDLVPALRERAPAVARDRHGLDPARPLVLFATTWVEWVTAHAGRYSASLAPIFRGFLRGVRDAASLRPQVVVKFHPGEIAADTANGLVDGYRALARAEGVDDVALVAGPLLPWLAAADVVVGVNSNVAFEAVLAGRVAVNVPAHPEEVHALYGPETAVLGAPTPDALAGAISTALADPGVAERLMARRSATVAHFNLAEDAGAARRVAAAALALLARARPRAIPAPSPPLVSLLVPRTASGAVLDLGEDDVPHELLEVRLTPGEDLAGACNRAARAARGRFVAVVDGRVAGAAGWLGRLLARVQGVADGLVIGEGGPQAPLWVALRRIEWEASGGLAPECLTLATRGGFTVHGTRGGPPARSVRPRQGGERGGAAEPPAEASRP